MVAPAVDRVADVPNAIAFRTSSVGFAGTGMTSCASPDFHCRPRGTISVTTDGGRTWRVLRSTPRPVVKVTVDGTRIRATYDNGVVVASADGGRTWRSARAPKGPAGPCAPGPNLYRANQVVVTPTGARYALCVYGAGAGNQAKAVFRVRDGRWRRIAWTPFGRGGYGGISTYGYPLGLAMSDDGFGLIWESRGTLYVTRDHGRHWIGEPKVARPELDFGRSGVALTNGVGYVVLANGGGPVCRLLMTTDAGRTWRVVHRWR
jgi:photosystem II stability/assembly factor-like uncharacterized protein